MKDALEVPPRLIKSTGARASGTLLLVGAVWVLLWVLRLQWASPTEVLWTTLLYLLCSLPTVIYVAGHKFRIPFMPMWGLGYFMLFGMPMISQEGQMALGFSTERAVTSALQLVVLGAAMCLLTFYTPLGQWFEAMAPRVRAPWDPRRAPVIGTILSLVGILLNYFQKTSPPSPFWGQILFVISQVGIMGMLTLFLLQLRGRLSLNLRILLWGFVIPVQYLLGLGTGSVHNSLVVLAPLLFCYTAERHKIPWIPCLVVLAVCFVPYSGFKSEFRSYAWYGVEGDIPITSSPIQRGMAFIQLVTKRLAEGGVEAYTVAAESAQARGSHLDLLITVMDATPTAIPFWGGETYRSILWVFVPRALFPDKPEKTVGQEFGHRYGILGETDVETSLNLPHQVVEMYINFGVIGVLIGMGIIGCLYRAVAAFLDHPEAGERGLIIGCGLLTNLLCLDGDFSLIFGGIMYYMVVMYLTMRVLGEPSSVPISAGPARV